MSQCRKTVLKNEALLSPPKINNSSIKELSGQKLNEFQLI
jgi:hypothetical protein